MTIPNPGLDGFIAQLLWHLYVHLPSPGNLDYLFLFLAVGLMVHLSLLPLLLRPFLRVARSNVRSDDKRPALVAVSLIPAPFLCVLLWVVQGDAGKSLLAGREMFSESVVTPAGWWCLTALVPGFFAVLVLADIFESVNLELAESAAFMAAIGYTIVGSLQLLYPFVRWSLASEALMHAFALSGIASNCVVLFVAQHLKNTMTARRTH